MEPEISFRVHKITPLERILSQLNSNDDDDDNEKNNYNEYEFKM